MLYYKVPAEIESMQAMTGEFNEDRIVNNLYRFLGGNKKEYLPHHVTLNEYLEKLEPAELEAIRDDIAYQMIRRKTFDEAKVLNHWLVLVDGTELDSGNRQKNEHYLERCYNRGMEYEKIKYHRAVLEAKLYLGKGVMVSIGTEAIENDDDYFKYKYSEEERKQDCEIKAFKGLAKKRKQAFLRLPICIVADGLYVAETIMDLCESNHWRFIIRYKEGCAKSIEEYRVILEKEHSGEIEYVNGMVYRARTLNVLSQKERKIKEQNEKTTEFKWITNIELIKRNTEKVAKAGRLRWKIENQGFNRQKRWQVNLEHACSWNA